MPKKRGEGRTTDERTADLEARYRKAREAYDAYAVRRLALLAFRNGLSASDLGGHEPLPGVPLTGEVPTQRDFAAVVHGLFSGCDAHERTWCQSDFGIDPWRSLDLEAIPADPCPTLRLRPAEKAALLRKAVQDAARCTEDMPEVFG